MKNYAFFDVDGTLLKIKTMFSFKEYFFLQYVKKNRFIMRLKYLYFSSRMKYYLFNNKPREYINKKFYECFLGVDRDSLKHCAYQWYGDVRNKNTDLFIPETLKLLQDHLAAGDEVIFVSGSSVDILEPLAKEFGVKHILATNMEVVNNKYTGKILHPQTIGQGKQLSIQIFMKNQEAHDGYTYAYGDDYSDIPMLNEVDFPVVISGDLLLERHADKMKWKKIILV